MHLNAKRFDLRVTSSDSAKDMYSQYCKGWSKVRHSPNAETILQPWFSSKGWVIETLERSVGIIAFDGRFLDKDDM